MCRSNLLILRGKIMKKKLDVHPGSDRSGPGPVPRPGILDIAAYMPGKSGTKKAGESGEVFKLSSNESPLGASPAAVAALGSLGGELAAYPEGSSADLRGALGDVHGLDPDRIMIGSGSDELLHLIAQTYLGEGDEAVISQYGFLMYPIATRAAGACPVFARDVDYRVDVDGMLDKVTGRTRVVFLANPNNPTGTYLDADALCRLHGGLPPDVLLVIDSAYAEYVTAQDYSAGEALVEAHENVVMVRTFSKIGLAALRIGWMYGPERIMDALNRVRGPFNINRAAQLAGEAAVRDREFIATLRAHNRKWRKWLSEQVASNGIRVLPSQGNFVLLLFEGGHLDAPAARLALEEAGIVVREMGAYGLPDALRVSIGTEKAMRKVAAVLKSAGDA